MDKTLKRYINDLTITLLIGECPDDKDKFINFNKIRLHMLGAIKNYAGFRIKLLQNPNITKVEHEVLKKAFRVAIDSGCKKYDIRIPDEVKDKLVDEYFGSLLCFIHEKRFDLFMFALSYCDDQLRQTYES